MVGGTLRQYHMAEHITQLVSHCFYAEAFEVGRAPLGTEYEKLPSFLASQVVCIDTQDQGREALHRPTRPHEGALEKEQGALVIVEVVRAMLTSTEFLEQVHAQEGDHEPIIGVIAMHSDQRDMIRDKLEQAERFGRELFPASETGTNQAEDACSDVFDYIEMFYDAKRRHGFNNQLSPIEFDKRYAISLQGV